MIKSKEDFIDYLENDKKQLKRNRKRPRYNDYIWKYQILLRKCEYYTNCKGGFINKIVLNYYKFKRFHLGIKCCFSIPLNVIDNKLPNKPLKK